MIAFWTILACSEVEEKDNDSDSNDNEPSVEDTGDTAEEGPQPFRPTQGHWAYSGGDLIPEGTTCPTGDNDGGVTDPAGFEMSLIDGGFQILSDGESTPVLCTLDDPESLDPGGYTCAASSTNLVFPNIDDGFGNSMDITMRLDTNSVGLFSIETVMQSIFTLTMTCTGVDHPFFDVSCSDIQSEFPTPCNIKFNANAALD